MLIYLLLINFLLPQAAIISHGSWSTEWSIYKNINLNDTHHSNKNYIIQNFELSPEIILNDNVSINSKWYFIGAIGKDSIQFNRDNMDMGYVYGSSNYGLSIIPNELYLDWKTDYFTLKAGRQSFDFGLGMFKLGNKYTDVVDRIVFNFPFDTVYIKAGVDILQNNDLTNLDDTYEAMMFEAGYKQDLENIEMKFLFYKTYMASTATIYDIYIRKNFPIIALDIKAETAYRTLNNKNAFGFSVDLTWKYNNFITNLKTGLATGDSSETITDRTFTFSPGYQIAMLLFQQDLGSGSNTIYNLDGIGGAYNGLGAFYISPGFSYIWNKFIFNTTFTFAQTQKAAASNPAKDLGYECDFNFTYNVYENFSTYIKAAILKPGTYFAGKDIAYGLIMGIETDF